MKNLNYCGTSSYCANHGFEIFGIILIVIATILTVITGNGLGIVALFLVGCVLCRHKCLMKHECCQCPKTDIDAIVLPEDTIVEEKKPTVKKTKKTTE